jgi:hypothetical protein
MAAVPGRRFRVEGATEEDGRSFGGLINRLLNEVLRLLDLKFALLKTELKEELGAAIRRSVLLAVGAVVAALGAVLLIVGLAVWVGELIGSPPGGFAIVGGGLALGGTLLLIVMRHRLAEQRVVPEETVRELRRDVEWIKHEL